MAQLLFEYRRAQVRCSANGLHIRQAPTLLPASDPLLALS